MWDRIEEYLYLLRERLANSASFIRLVTYSSVLLVGVIAGVLLVAYSTASSIYEYRDNMTFEGELPEVDVVVCLAGGRGRIRLAGNIWYRYYEQAKAQKKEPPMLYISGMGPRANINVLAKQVDKKVMDVLTFRQIILETESGDTVGNAEWFTREVKKKNWSSMVLVTSSYHMRRARYIFEKTLEIHGLFPGFKINILSQAQAPFSKAEWKSTINGIRVTIDEFLKMIVFRTTL